MSARSSDAVGEDSYDVNRSVIFKMASWRRAQQEQDASSSHDISPPFVLTFDFAVRRRDAEYIVECISQRVLLQQQQERIVHQGQYYL
jgi:hypothetical protein